MRQMFEVVVAARKKGCPRIPSGLGTSFCHVFVSPRRVGKGWRRSWLDRQSHICSTTEATSSMLVLDDGIHSRYV
jgi:hypothetical protein